MSFDLDAAVAATEPEPFRFTWGGEECELPAVLALPIERQLAMVSTIERLKADASAADIIEALNVIVGADKLAELNAIKPMGASTLMKLIEAWMADQGDTLGKS